MTSTGNAAGVATDLTVIIPTFDRPEALARNLAALAGATGVDLGRTEVIVVNDGSTDPDTASLLDRLVAEVPYRLVPMTQDNAGQARARNRALAVAEGRILLFINDDTRPTPALLAEHLRAHARDPAVEVAVLGRTTLAPEISLTTPRALHLDNMWRRIEGRQLLAWYHFWTTNVSVKAAFLHRHALVFDDHIRYVHDDTEFGYRLHGHGLRLRYAPAALGYHDHAISEDDFLRMASREAASLVYWARKTPTAVPELARFGYVPARSAWERRIKYPLLALVLNRWSVPLWRRLSQAAARVWPRLSRVLLSQCYGHVKRSAIAARLRAKNDPV